jgi:hypothetical protein
MDYERLFTAYLKNAAGPFYVVHERCIACQAPESEAPDLMTHDEGEEIGYQCYFKKQPTTPEQLDQAINAVIVSCCGAVRYAGRDPEILKRICDPRWEPYAIQCDALLDPETRSVGPFQARRQLEKHVDPMWDVDLDS